MKLGLIGKKLSHSKSPEIHQRLFGLQHIDGTYSLLEIQPDSIETILSKLYHDGYEGINVTIPYKIDIMPFLTKISQEAVSIGAVNTIHLTDQGFFGFNTDYSGFSRSLDHAGIRIQDTDCVVLGTGGAARAIIQSLFDKGAASIIVVSRHPRSKPAFCKFLEQIGGREIDYDELARLQTGGVLVNCTPVGMYPKMDDSPVSEDIVSRYGAVVDLIYNPRDTIFLQYGKKHGAMTLNGMYMLVAQAIGAEEIWQGKSISSSVIEKIVKEMGE